MQLKLASLPVYVIGQQVTAIQVRLSRLRCLKMLECMCQLRRHYSSHEKERYLSCKHNLFLFSTLGFYLDNSLFHYCSGFFWYFFPTFCKTCVYQQNKNKQKTIKKGAEHGQDLWMEKNLLICMITGLTQPFQHNF